MGQPPPLSRLGHEASGPRQPDPGRHGHPSTMQRNDGEGAPKTHQPAEHGRNADRQQGRGRHRRCDHRIGRSVPTGGEHSRDDQHQEQSGAHPQHQLVLHPRLETPSEPAGAPGRYEPCLLPAVDPSRKEPYAVEGGRPAGVGVVRNNQIGVVARTDRHRTALLIPADHVQRPWMLFAGCPAGSGPGQGSVGQDNAVDDEAIGRRGDLVRPSAQGNPARTRSMVRPRTVLLVDLAGAISQRAQVPQIP